MADAAPSPAFLVDAESDPVAVRVLGRASFQNSACLKDFIGEMLRTGRVRFVLDFERCSGIDSTFLGVLAGAALELRKRSGGGSLVLARVGERNLELMRNLGLHRLLVIDGNGPGPIVEKCRQEIACSPRRSELENARLVLEAHENLVAADPSNLGKFQDVLVFLRSRVNHG
jgi:anti-anti-sigma regulatory factor